VKVPVADPAVTQSVETVELPDGTFMLELDIEVVGPPLTIGDTLGDKLTVPANPYMLVTVIWEKVWEPVV